MTYFVYSFVHSLFLSLSLHTELLVHIHTYDSVDSAPERAENACAREGKGGGATSLRHGPNTISWKPDHENRTTERAGGGGEDSLPVWEIQGLESFPKRFI